MDWALTFIPGNVKMKVETKNGTSKIQPSCFPISLRKCLYNGYQGHDWIASSSLLPLDKYPDHSFCATSHSPSSSWLDCFFQWCIHVVMLPSTFIVVFFSREMQHICAHTSTHPWKGNPQQTKVTITPKPNLVNQWVLLGLLIGKWVRGSSQEHWWLRSSCIAE